MRKRIAAAALAAGLGGGAASAEVAWQGFLRLGGASVEAPRSWLAGGLGKLDGGDSAGERAEALAAEARLALAFEPAVGWRLFVQGAARTAPSAELGGGPSGLIEAYAERRAGFGEGHELVARAGQFFLDTSREAVAPLWTTPYTLTPSALTTWVGEELRPVGLDLVWRKSTAGDHRLGLGATAFGGNDTAGALIAWRGFALHDRPTPLGDFLPLPGLESIATIFPAQSARGTRPFGHDLDGRPGGAVRARWDAPGRRASLQATGVDNRGDRELHGDEYAWATRLTLLGGSFALPGGLELAGEWLRGATEMGIAPAGSRSRSMVDDRFDARYLLASWSRGPWRLSARYDRFETVDRDGTAGDENGETGRGRTAALIYSAGERWRLALEWLELDAHRPIGAALGGPTLDGDALRAEIRCSF